MASVAFIALFVMIGLYIIIDLYVNLDEFLILHESEEDAMATVRERLLLLRPIDVAPMAVAAGWSRRAVSFSRCSKPAVRLTKAA